MRAVGLLPALLLGLVLGQAASYAEAGVTLTICNAGKVDIDAYLVRQASTLTTHVPPAKCGVLEKVEGDAKPGAIGLGFADTKGQWGGSRRSDVWPDSIDGVFESVKQTLTVKHGTASVNIPGLISYEGASPVCSRDSGPTVIQPRSTTTAGRIADAVRGSPSPSGPVVCHDQTHSLTVIPYADSHELALDSHCYPCESPEERAALENQSVSDLFGPIANLPGRGGPIGQAILNLDQSVIDQDKAERARRNEIAKGPYQMNWKDLASFFTSAFGVRGRPPLMANRHIILRGTLSRVQTPKPGAQPAWVYAFFKDVGDMEKPVNGLPGDYSILPYLGKENAFGICSTDPSIFSEIFGANYGATMVGKTVEMAGELNSGGCGTAAGIKVTLARQLKVVTQDTPMAKGQTWVPAMRQPQQPAAPEVSAMPAPATRTAPPVIMSQQEAARAAAARPVNRSPAQSAPNPAPVTTASVAPAQVPVSPAPSAPTASVRDPLINNVISLLRAKAPELQIMLMLKRRNRTVNLTGADRGELEDAGASEKLIEAIMHPASIGPEVTPEAAAAAARQNAAPQRGPR